ncbi:MAG: hypothetical protein AABY42_08605 [Nitrospirota bacterium]
MKTVMIISGESSGDLYGSLLAKALKGLWQEVRVIGIGGEKMRDAGVGIISGISGALGLTEILPSIKKIHDSFKAAKNAIAEARPDVVVLIDYPDFNFRIGKFARRLGVKVFYYVSPQVWAWRKGRVREMAKFVDRMAVILPFEEAIYRKAGMPCEFVGHPAMEEIEEFEKNIGAGGCVRLTDPGKGQAEDRSNQQSKVDSQEMLIQNPKSKIQNPVIALLPGSRPNELKMLLPVFVGLAGLLKKEFPCCKLMLPVAPNIEEGRFRTDLEALERKGVTLERGGALKTLASSDAAVIASGTATLQAALLGIPMVVVYKVAPLTYFLGKLILDVRHISLVNVIEGRGVVNEFIQQNAEPLNIVEELKRILYDYRYRENMTSTFMRIRELFFGKRPSQRVAIMTGELAGWPSVKTEAFLRQT